MRISDWSSDVCSSDLFATCDRAIHRFGQPLAPAATFALGPVDRPGRAALDAVFTESPAAELIVVTGDQGCGKSWAVAQAWLAQTDPPFLLFLTRSEEHTSELQSLMRNSYAVFCLKK